MLSIKEEIARLLEKHSTIRLSITEVDQLDLQVLQMIFAFQRAARTEGKEVQLDVQLPEQLQALVQQSGLMAKFNLSRE